MGAVLLFLLLGLGAGSVYALLGLGLVLKYRSTGAIDFAHGAVAMYCAYVFVRLRSTGDLELPWIVLPHSIPMSPDGMSLLPALAISLVYGTVLGLVVFALVYRPLLRAAPLTKVCASVGIMLLFEAIAVLNFGTTAQAGLAVLPSSPIRMGGIAFPSDRLWLTAIVVVTAAALYGVFRFTRFGLSTRAAAENDTGAALVGISPVGIAARNWGIASLLAAASGILITPISSLDPTSYTLFIVPALGAALIGRFKLFGWTAFAGLTLGVAQSELTKLQSVWTWLPQQGLGDGFPLVVIIIAMTVGASRLGIRGSTDLWRNPALGRPTRPVLTSVLMLLIGIAFLVLLHGSLRAAFQASLVNICICLSLVVLSGFIGQVSLAQMTFVGLGAFFLSHLTADLGLPFPLSLLAAAVAVVPVGILIGVPALRVRGVSLAVVTLAVAAAADALVFSNVPFTGGLGGRTIDSPTIAGIDVGVAAGGSYPSVVFGVILLVVVVAVGYAVSRLRLSATGRKLIAIRSNERAAAYVGIHVASTKLYAFGLSSFIAGLGGALLAYQQGTVSSASFAVFTSLSALAITYVAGIGRVAGAVIAGVMFASNGLLVTFLDNVLHIGQYQMIVAGFALAFTAVMNPSGVASDLAGDKGPGRWVRTARDRVFPMRAPAERRASTPPTVTMRTQEATDV